MKYFKKISVFLLLMLLLVGCQSQNDSKKENTVKKETEKKVETKEKIAKKEVVKLTIAARGGSHAEVIESVKAEFENKNNCKIEVLGLEGADLKQKAALDSANKEGAYDLIMVDDPVMPEFIKGGVLLNLTELGYKDDTDFVPASAALGKGPYKTGDTYALPFTGNVQLLFYNKSLLDSVGQDIPKSWDEVLKVAKAVKEKGSLGYVIRGQQGNPIVGDFMPILWAFGGDVFDKDWNVIVDSKETREALKLYQELLKVGANYEKDDIVGSVSGGGAAMGLGWPSWFISGEGASAGYAKIPSKISVDSKEYNTGMIGNWMMGVTSNSKNKDLAFKLLKYLTSEEVQKASVSKGGVPTRTSIFKNEQILAKFPYFEAIYEGTLNSAVRPRTPKWSKAEEVFGIELSNVLSGVKDVDSALKDAQKSIERVMK